MIAVQPQNVMWPCIINVFRLFFLTCLQPHPYSHSNTYIESPVVVMDVWVSPPPMTSVLVHERKFGKSKKAVHLIFWGCWTTQLCSLNIPCCGCILVGIDFFYKYLEKQEYEGVHKCIWLISLSSLGWRSFMFCTCQSFTVWLHNCYILQMIVGLLFVPYSDES